MTDILYYSNHCNHSKKILEKVSKTHLTKKIHFICIDNRVKEDGKTFIVLQTGQKIIMPENILKVPAVLNLTNYSIFYGDDIYSYLTPRQQVLTTEATQGNEEPLAFSFDNGNSGVVSDNFSFLDSPAESLAATGDGGMRQMYSYASVDYNNAPIDTPTDQFGARKMGMSMDQIQKKRDMDFVQSKPY